MTEASRKLGISQPALSESLQRLESDLNAKLFYRARNGISLTPLGRTVVEKARKAVDALFEVESLGNDRAVPPETPIRMGCHPVVASYVLPQAFKLLEKSFPDFRIELKHDLSRVIQAGIQNGDIDVGVVINPVLSQDLIIRTVAKDRVCVWAHPKLSDSKRVFANLELFQTQAIFRKWKARPAATISSNSLELIGRLTAAGLGFGILPERAAKLLSARLKRLDDLPSYSDDIALVYRPEFGKRKNERALLEALHKAITEGSS